MLRPDPGAPVLPPVHDLRETSAAVAAAAATATAEDDVARADLVDVEAAVRAVMWQPVYPPVEAV
ncbi:hypothetical protein [Streptomyces sp. NPDC051636]|uniref:hypothetical protein n=1 Tax=Streptomyces sp. NPDC051636 TaxID=3365663 RepID=UPI0037AAA3E8